MRTEEEQAEHIVTAEQHYLGLSWHMKGALIDTYCMGHQLQHINGNTLNSLHYRKLCSKIGDMTALGYRVRKRLLEREYKIKDINAITHDEARMALDKVLHGYASYLTPQEAKMGFGERLEIQRSRYTYRQIMRDYITQQEGIFA